MSPSEGQEFPMTPAGSMAPYMPYFYPPFMRPSPAGLVAAAAQRLRLNVTIFFSPDVAFNPCEPIWRGMETESLQILVVMDAAKSVSHLRRRIAESLAILSREQQRSFAGSDLSQSMIRNQLNSLVHGEMSLGDAFVNEESITAVIVTARTGKFPLSVAHSFQSPAYQETRRIVEPTRKSSDDYPSSSPSHMVRPVFSSRTDAAELNDRPLKKRKHEHLESPSFVETASKVDDEEEEEEDGDSEDSYESSFVVDDDVIEHDNIKDHYLDLEAEEGSESQPSTESEGEGEDITVSDTEQRDRSNRPRSRRIVDDDDEEEDAPQPEAGKLKDRLQKLLQKQMDKDQARQPRSGVVDAAKEMPTPYDSVSQLSSEAIKEADKAKEVPVVDTPALPVDETSQAPIVVDQLNCETKAEASESGSSEEESDGTSSGESSSESESEEPAPELDAKQTETAKSTPAKIKAVPMKRNFSSLSQLASSAKFETKEIENRTEAKGSDQESSSSGSDDGSSDSDSSSSSDEEADAPAQPARRSRRKSILSALSKDAAESQPRVASQKKVTVKVTPMKAQTAVVQTPVSNKSTTMESKRTASNGKVISTPATISAKQSRKVLLSSSDEE